MAATERYAEKLLILNDAAQGLKARLFNFKRKVVDSSMRPWYLENNEMKKLNDSFIKHFPEIPPTLEKIPGYEQLMAKSQAIMEDIEPHYHTLVDTLEFKENAFHLFTDISNSISTMKFTVNPMITSGFMNLLVDYIKILLLLGSLPDRKLCCSYYARAHALAKRVPDTNFSRVALFMSEYDNPFRRIQEEFMSISSRVGEVLSALIMPYSIQRNLGDLRKNAHLIITAKPDQISSSSSNIFLHEQMRMHQFQEWVIFGLLFCPNELANASLMELLKQALQEGWVQPIYRDESFSVHAEYETLFGWFKGSNVKLSQHKKVLPEALQNAITNGPKIHRERRIFCRQELQTLCNIIKLHPGLVCPKLPAALSLLSMAVGELNWFYSHAGKAPPKSKAKLKEDEMKDAEINELVHLVVQVHDVINANKSMINVYYAEYLNTIDVKAIEPLIEDCRSKNLPDNLKNLLGNLVSDLKAIKVADSKAGKKIEMTALRLNWLRAEAALSSATMPLRIGDITVWEPLMKRMCTIVLHSKFLDRFSDAVDEFTSLKNLWWYRDAMLKELQNNIKSPGQGHVWISVLKSFNYASENATRQLPGERGFLGKVACELTNRTLQQVSVHVAQIITKACQRITGLAFEASAVQAELPKPKNLKSKSKDEAVAAKPKPGRESYFHGSNPVTDELDNIETNLCKLLSAVSSLPDGVFTVYNHVFCPATFLQDRLLILLRNHTRSACKFDMKEGHIERPSVVLKHIEHMTYAITRVTNLVNIEAGVILREVLSDTLRPLPKDNTGNVFYWYKAFYTNLFVRQCQASSCTTYSPLRKAWMSVPGTPMKQMIGMYTDPEELRALASIIGPIGIRVICNDLSTRAVDIVANEGIQKFIVDNRSLLEDLSRNYHSADAVLDISRKIKNIDDIVTRLVLFGNLHMARKELIEAAGYVMKRDMPETFDTLNEAYKMYQVNSYGYTVLNECDNACMAAGINISPADPMLFSQFKKYCSTATDASIWALLPQVFSLCFFSQIWRDASFHSTIEAYSNNLSVFPLAMAKLLTVSSAHAATIIKTEGDLTLNDKLIVTKIKETFTNMSAVLLKYPKDGKGSGRDISTMLVCVDKMLAELSPYVVRSDFDPHFPYALIRNAYTSLYKAKRNLKAKEENQSGAPGEEGE